MTSEQWHAGISPKLKGAWNLHYALEGHASQLDFFLITSSVAGSVGTVTESNYCSANSFLDSFARYRRSHNLPAISIGLGMISEVGYLHEHPEIEAMLLRKGIHPLNEDELLRVCDIALSQQFLDRSIDSELGSMYFAEGHILTGLELTSLKQIRDKGFEAQNTVLNDPRASILNRALNEANLETPSTNTGDSSAVIASLLKAEASKKAR